MPLNVVEIPPQLDPPFTVPQERIKLGDKKAGTALDPQVFKGVSDRLTTETQHQHDHARGQPYSDNPKNVDEPALADRRASKGGGVPTSGRKDAEGPGGAAGSGGILDIMSMDMNMTGGASEGKRCHHVSPYVALRWRSFECALSE